MATLDSLDKRLDVLEGRMDFAFTQIEGVSDRVHNQSRESYTPVRVKGSKS